jgi:hypothetical protein
MDVSKLHFQFGFPLIKFISKILAEIGSPTRMKYFWPFFARILANLINFDVKMFCPGDFDIKIVRCCDPDATT